MHFGVARLARNSAFFRRESMD